MDDNDVRVLIDAVVAAPLGCDALGDPLEDLIRGLRDPIPLNEAKRLLGVLRSHRCFDAMTRVADALLSVGTEYTYVRRQYAQALIERGQLDLAIQMLRLAISTLAPSDPERSEILGLLGRAHKQRFVDRSENRDLAKRELDASVNWYLQGYDLDRAWHGANLVALVRRAEHDGIVLERRLRSQDVTKS